MAASVAGLQYETERAWFLRAPPDELSRDNQSVRQRSCGDTEHRSGLTSSRGLQGLLINKADCSILKGNIRNRQGIAHQSLALAHHICLTRDQDRARSRSPGVRRDRVV